VLGGGKWSASHLGRFTYREGALLCLDGWVGPRGGGKHIFTTPRNKCIISKVEKLMGLEVGSLSHAEDAGIDLMSFVITQICCSIDYPVCTVTEPRFLTADVGGGH
jgi:hypothetical protein